MKKTIFTILILLILKNCMVLNPLGLHTDRVKGNEAAAQIRSAAIKADLISGLIGRGGVGILSIIADKIASINESGYYYKPEVDKCVSTIEGATGIIIGSTLTILLVGDCSLTEDKSILDSPFPEL